MYKQHLLTALGAVIFSSAAIAGGNHGGGHAAIGKPGVAAKVTRTVEVDMTDAMRFQPSTIDVRQGETVRFKVRNSGKLKHEFVLGTEKELRAHYKEMLKNPEMEHDDPNMISLAGGKAGQVIWQFTKTGTVHIGCLQPGHYEAGMKGAVSVSRERRSSLSPVEIPSSAGALAIVTTHDKPPTNRPGVGAGASEMVDGEVRRVDLEGRKITLRHAEIKSMDMPSMTMVFRLRDSVKVDGLKVGDKVRFSAEKAEGAIFVTDLQVAR